MKKRPELVLLYLVSLFSAMGLLLAISRLALSDAERFLLWILFIGLIISCVAIWKESKFVKRKADFTTDDLANRITGNPIRWARDGLIPPTVSVHLIVKLSKAHENAIEILNKRSINRNVAVWRLNNLLAKEVPWLINTDWRMSPVSPIQIDYGVGTTKMVYHLEYRKTRIPILVVKVSWRNCEPIFYFHGILSATAKRLWRTNFLKYGQEK